MNIQEHQKDLKDLKEILAKLEKVNILKKRNGSIIVYDNQEIESSNQFLIRLSDIRDTAKKMIDVIFWIQSTYEQDD